MNEMNENCPDLVSEYIDQYGEYDYIRTIDDQIEKVQSILSNTEGT